MGFSGNLQRHFLFVMFFLEGGGGSIDHGIPLFEGPGIDKKP